MTQGTKKQHIHISIEFNDAILPVIECEDGHQRVPLKPIAEQIGVNWSTQKRKLQPEAYLSKRLGVGYHPLKGMVFQQKQGNPTFLCIRLDRVEAFLNSINPENVRANDNHDAADWLEAKHQEWDDALHAYESTGVAINKKLLGSQEAKEKAYVRMSTVLKQKGETKIQSDRNLLTSMLKDMATYHGLSYQMDVLDDE